MLSGLYLQAQNDDDKFDYFEEVQEKKDIKMFNNASRNSLTRRRDTQNSWFMHPGNAVVSGGLYFQNVPRSVGAPGSFSIDVPVVPNFSVGFHYASYRFKGYEYIDSTTRTTSEWQSNNLKVRHNFYGVRGQVHLSQLLGLNYSLFDVYAKTIIGFNSVNGKTEILKFEESYYEKFHWHLAAGVRYLYNERFSMYMDIGKNGYGIINFGASYRLISTY